MARKFMAILRMVMFDLVLLVLIEVRANDLAFISFYPSPTRILLSQTTELYNKEGLFYNCISKKVKGCVKMQHRVDRVLRSFF